MVPLGPSPAVAANATPISSEVSCTQIREAVHGVAAAERNQALALHLMADGKPTPVVQTRLTELQGQIENLRGILRRARKSADRKDTDLRDCIALGSQSLTDAENVTRQIEDIVMGENGELALPAQIKPAGSDAEKLPEPPLPSVPSRAE